MHRSCLVTSILYPQLRTSIWTFFIMFKTRCCILCLISNMLNYIVDTLFVYWCIHSTWANIMNICKIFHSFFINVCKMVVSYKCLSNIDTKWLSNINTKYLSYIDTKWLLNIYAKCSSNIDIKCLSNIGTKYLSYIDTKWLLYYTKCLSNVHTKCLSNIDTKCFYNIDTNCLSFIDSKCLSYINTKYLSNIDTKCLLTVCQCGNKAL